jgi:signal transduction histidine kinase
MDIRAAEISDIIRKQIENYDKKVSVTETGTVLTAGDGIARVYGLSGAMAGELLEFEGAGGEKVNGMVLNLEEDNVGVALLGKFESVREGDVVRRTQKIVEVPVGEELLGRVVNAIGIPVDRVLFRRVIDNLLENAHKYSPDLDAPLALDVAREGNRVVFTVRDRGIGILAEDLPRVFTAFFRGDKSRSRETGGVGLGLTLAKRIVEAHGGTIEIASQTGEGTTVRVALPVVD